MDAATRPGGAAAAKGLPGLGGGELERFECQGRDRRCPAPMIDIRGGSTLSIAQPAVGLDALILEGEGLEGQGVELLLHRRADEGGHAVGEHRSILSRGACPTHTSSNRFC